MYVSFVMNMTHKLNIIPHHSLELRQGTGEKQKQQPDGAGESEGNQGWKRERFIKNLDLSKF